MIHKINQKDIPDFHVNFPSFRQAFARTIIVKIFEVVYPGDIESYIVENIRNKYESNPIYRSYFTWDRCAWFIEKVD